ncbi:MAG: Peptide transporter substrate-binding protein, partial [Hyphomicrobiales bacterium]|nr:Peptide transporter substrate-binding protein [Hyphomicrobiales bacterium]
MADMECPTVACVQHKDYVRENGTPASSNQGRYVNDALSAQIDKLRAIPTNDPQIKPIGTEFE